MPYGNPSQKTIQNYYRKAEKIFIKYAYMKNTESRFCAMPESKSSYKCYFPPLPPQTRDILVTGTGRCGTTTLSKAFQMLGLDILHERTGKEGTVSHFFAFDSDWYPILLNSNSGKAHVGERKSNFIFKYNFMLVRDPISCISSMETEFPISDYVFLIENNILPKKVLLMSRLARSVYNYYYVNKYILDNIKLDGIIRIEKIDTDFQIINKLTHCGEYPLKPEEVYNKKKEFLSKTRTLDKIYDSCDVAEKAIDLGKYLGYKT